MTGPVMKILQIFEHLSLIFSHFRKHILDPKLEPHFTFLEIGIRILLSHKLESVFYFLKNWNLYFTFLETSTAPNMQFTFSKTKFEIFPSPKSQKLIFFVPHLKSELAKTFICWKPNRIPIWKPNWSFPSCVCFLINQSHVSFSFKAFFGGCR